MVDEQKKQETDKMDAMRKLRERIRQEKELKREEDRKKEEALDKERREAER